MIDELVYYSSLLICILLGHYYKSMQSLDMKRSYGAGLGFLVTALICGRNLTHSVFLVWGNVIIIKLCDKRYVHQISMAYTWIYLLYLHFHSSSTACVIWLYQTMALRLVGLAFEMNSMLQNATTRNLSFAKLSLGDISNQPVEPTAVDIVVYAYFFIGLHKGPYYRWKTFHEQFTSPIVKTGDYKMNNQEKFIKAIVFAFVYAVIYLKFSPKMYNEDDFYYKRGSDYRFLYNTPQLAMFILKSELLMMLCTTVFTEAGFGVQPANCEPKPGRKSTAHYSSVKFADSIVPLEQEYHCRILKCYENYKLLIGPKMKDSLKGWDMPTQRWFWSNIYKRLLQAPMEIRSACSFFAWAVWYGPSVQHMIVASTLWVYVHLEAEYVTLYNTAGSEMKVPWNIGFSIMRIFCLIYLTPCLVISDTSTVLRYYNSIFWMYHFLLIIMVVGAIVSYRGRQLQR